MATPMGDLCDRANNDPADDTHHQQQQQRNQEHDQLIPLFGGLRIEEHLDPMDESVDYIERSTEVRRLDLNTFLVMVTFAQTTTIHTNPSR